MGDAHVQNKDQRVHIVCALLLAATMLAGFLFAGGRAIAEETTPALSAPAAPDVSDLEAQIRDKQTQIKDLESQQTTYQAAIERKQQEALSLQNQLGILDDQIAKTGLEIHKLNLQIESLELEIRDLENTIKEKQRQIDDFKDRLAAVVRTINQYGRRTQLEISLANATFSEFFNQLKYLETVSKEAKRDLDQIKTLKEQYEEQQAAREEKKQQSETKQQTLTTEKGSLEDQQGYRETLLSETKESEAKFSDLLEQAKQEQISASADIQSLETQIRQRLASQNALPQSPTDYVWPVESRRISTYFHDPTYIFRRYFEHPGIDIPTPQGSPVRAIASGYVSRAKDAGYGYSYIALIHGNDLSSVYGHLSKLSVIDNDFVAQGEIIGYSGGTPGTPGAGRLTTGAHVHLEVRQTGIPVNPLNYLP